MRATRLIGDTEGIYHPRDFNDRLLLGLKGTMSEAELHSLRLRLDAGRLSKARRAELVQHLPTGYMRDPDGTVVIDPDASVRQRIELIFEKFQELGSAQKVLGYLAGHELPIPRRQTAGLYAGELLWKPASSAALLSILKNPAYAGAFAYGRRISDPSRQTPGRPASGRIRQSPEDWQVLVKDAYPAYITWAEHERIQQQIEDNYRTMQQRMQRQHATPGDKALLVGLVRCGFCGRQMRISYKDNRFQYHCSALRQNYRGATCQHLSGRHIDQAVVASFFEAIDPAQIDALESISARQQEHQQALVYHLKQEVARLDYAARRAEKQYNAVDPENRLIAATLERKWEVALSELEAARAKLTEAESAAPEPVRLSANQRAALADVGRHLPQLWPGLSTEARRALLRTLVREVHLARAGEAKLKIRIVWPGQLVTEKIIPIPALSWRGTERERRTIARIGELSDEGLDAGEIATRLNGEGWTACRGMPFTRGSIMKLKRQHGILDNLTRVRRGNLPDAYTVREMAALIQVHPSWFSRQITRGRLKLTSHARYGCYLFPKTSEIVETVKALKTGELREAIIPEVHHES